MYMYQYGFKIMAKCLSLGICATIFTGCASLVNGRTQEVNISSNPIGATVYVDGRNSGITPTKVILSRKEDHMITLKKQGYRDQNISVIRSISGAVAGNLIAGGFVGWGVDAISGAQYKLIPENVIAELVPSAVEPLGSSQEVASQKSALAQTETKTDTISMNTQENES